jgi:uncharacterized protein YdeI (YjbR/CyaY-like superfamily)
MKTDPRSDAYIESRQAFAQPILRRIRAAVHAACPDVEETLKWSMPSFVYKGKILAGMAAFKAHATLGFWNGSELLDEGARQDGAMGQFGRLTSVDDLPQPAELAKLIEKAMALVDSGAKPARAVKPKPPFTVPDDLRVALDKAPAAAATFDGFAPSAQRDYVEWVTEAKREETRAKRVAQAVEWMAEGKKRHWKYENC